MAADGRPSWGNRTITHDNSAQVKIKLRGAETLPPSTVTTPVSFTEFRSMKDDLRRVIQQVGIVLRDVLLAGAEFLLASELHPCSLWRSGRSR
jgi:hypothetical protein